MIGMGSELSTNPIHGLRLPKEIGMLRCLA